MLFRSLGFNKYKYHDPGEHDIPYTNFTYIPSNVTYVESDIIQTWAYRTSGSIGLAAKFSGSGYIQIRENVGTPWYPQTLSPEKDEDFTLSFWMFVDSHYATNVSPYTSDKPWHSSGHISVHDPLFFTRSIKRSGIQRA